jgi:acetylornithine/succinyldiaminopimelate/putrescine aminotransferase/predicted amino acid dehydrogenase
MSRMADPPTILRPPPAAAPGPASRQAYGRYLKPRLLELFQAFGLDVEYHRAAGDTLFYRDESGAEIPVLDLLGGFGASLLGHNHPELVEVAHQVLDQCRPFNAQASIRGQAGLLAERLSARVQRATGRSYVVTLANSGAEAVEAAVKHAELERVRRNARRTQELQDACRRLRIRLREGTAFLPEGFLAHASSQLHCPPLATLDALFGQLLQAAGRALEAGPTFLAITGAFHGKSTGALQLTHNLEYRSPWRDLGRAARFLPVDEPGPLAAEIEQARLPFHSLEVGADGSVALRPATALNISACFVEPIQGEGGIREVGCGYLALLRAAADAGGFPLVLDEIQCGMGRAGTFLAAEAAGVRGDYYLLSKSLGGGLCKVSALLVERDRFLPDFGYLHTSTFADDDLSSAVALRVLDILERDDGELLRRCRRQGDYLLDRLRTLRERFPGQLRDVRGRGLMIGIELAPQSESASALLRVVSDQDLLSYLVSGYLLREHAIRVAPTLSAHGTIRVEPSAYVSTEDLERFCAAFERLLGLLRDGDVQRLVGFMAGRSAAALGAASPPPAAAPAPRVPAPHAPPPLAIGGPSSLAARVAFLAHFAEASDVQVWEPRLADLSQHECERFLERTRGLLKPFVLDSAEIRSALGSRVEVVLIAVPFTPEQAMRSLRSGEGWGLEMVRQALELARQLGCSVAGLGGHTSIVSDNCRDLVEDELALTSGNSLTVTAAYEALRRSARRIGLPLATARLGVVGGAGNIGAVIAELACEEVGSILLVGRRGAARHLRVVADDLYAAAVASLRQPNGAPGPIARAIAETATVRRAMRLAAAAGPPPPGLERSLSDEMGEAAPVQVATEIEALRGCSLVVSATNAARPVVLPAHIGEGEVVVCDVAVPCDVDPGVQRERPLARVIRGGLVRAPFGQEIRLGNRLSGGELYGCLAETLLLGFAGYRHHYSYGKLTAARVRQIGDLAVLHGFEIEEKLV